MEIPSTLFTDCASVGELKKHFAQYDGGATVIEDDASDTTDEPSDASTPYEREAGSTPPSSAPSVDGNDVDIKVSEEIVDGEASVARKLVAEEMGVDVSEITDDLDLTDIGMDSLMSLTILGSMREQTGRDLPADFLTVNVTIKDIETALDMRPAPKEVKVTAKITTKAPQLAEVNKKLAQAIVISQLLFFYCLLLHRNLQHPPKQYFFLHGGCRSPNS